MDMSLCKAISYALLPRDLEAFKKQAEKQDPESLKFDVSALSKARKDFYVTTALTILVSTLAYGSAASLSLRLALVGLNLCATSVRSAQLYSRARELVQQINQNNLTTAPVCFIGSEKVAVSRPARTEAEKEMEAILTDAAIEKAPNASQFLFKYENSDQIVRATGNLAG